MTGVSVEARGVRGSRVGSDQCPLPLDRTPTCLPCRATGDVPGETVARVSRWLQAHRKRVDTRPWQRAATCWTRPCWCCAGTKHNTDMRTLARDADISLATAYRYWSVPGFVDAVMLRFVAARFRPASSSSGHGPNTSQPSPLFTALNGSLAGFIAYPKPPIGNWRQPQSADADALIEGLAYIQPCGIAVFIASAVAVAWKTIGLVKQ